MLPTRYVKNNGEIIMHKKLSRDRPCFKPIKIGCDQHLVQVICKNNVVWALTSDRCILVRNGVKEGEEEGTLWTVLEYVIMLINNYTKYLSQYIQSIISKRSKKKKEKYFIDQLKSVLG